MRSTAAVSVRVTGRRPDPESARAGRIAGLASVLGFALAAGLSNLS